MRIPLLTLVLVLAACGATSPMEGDVSDPPETLPSIEPTTTIPDLPVEDPRPVWEGFAATQPTVDGLVAYARGPLDIFESPDALAPFTTIDETTIIGTTTVLGVIGEPHDGWAQVMLPVRPNGSTGWIPVSEVDLYIADSEIIVELSERRLTYRVGNVDVLTTEVGIGSVYNETPIGQFFVTDNVTLADPDSPWGPHALGLSARSDTVTSFNGGDGIIGIHGTNNPSSIGGNISLGCVRLPNEAISALHALVPIGTRVTIEA